MSSGHGTITGARSDIRRYPEGDAVCELGGMRFPAKAKATWQVFSEAFGEDQVFQPFPNPGIVPTILCDKGETFPWHVNGSEAPDLPPQFSRIAGDVATAMNSLADDRGTDSIQVQGLLVLATLTPAQEEQLQHYWNYMVEHFDNVTFGAWIHERVAKPNNWTQDDLARFFNLGFGTGGMGSLFPVGFLEMLRIWIWDYADEYALPPGWGLGSVARKIMTNLLDQYSASGKFSVHQRHEVQEVGCFASNDGLVARPGILVRDLSTPGDEGNNLQSRYGDYLVIAVPHTAAVALTSLTADRSYPRNNLRASVNINSTDCRFYSYFDRGTSPAFNRYIQPQKNAIARLNMVNASKSFVTFQPPQWDVLPANWRRIDLQPVKCILNEGWPRASYFLPANPNDDKSPCALLLSYTWNLDSTKYRAVLNVAKSREPALINPEPANWFGNSQTWWRSYRTAAAVFPYAFAPQTGDLGLTTQIFLNSTSTADSAVTSIDWQDEQGSAGGFKLDAAGDFQTSNTLAYAYLLTEEAAFVRENARWKTYQRIHFASDSAGNYGGWCEGAFMSGANAAIAVLASINKNKLKPLPASIFAGNPFAAVNKLVPLKPYERAAIR